MIFLAFPAEITLCGVYKLYTYKFFMGTIDIQNIHHILCQWSLSYQPIMIKLLISWWFQGVLGIKINRNLVNKFI